MFNMLVRFVIKFSVQNLLVFAAIFVALIQGLITSELLFLLKPGVNCHTKRQKQRNWKTTSLRSIYRRQNNTIECSLASLLYHAW